MAKPDLKVVVIGGGTGTFVVLSGLKLFTPNITAIISMVDDGGSTGILRDELGVLPPGDVRQALVALSSRSELMRSLFSYRFEEGSLRGHAFGNLFLSALEKVTGSFTTAVETASEVLAVVGEVIPVTTENVQLGLKADDGRDVLGQLAIDSMTLPMRPQLYLSPKASLNPQAAKAIAQADLIVLAAGSLYSSLAPSLMVQNMGGALRRASAPKVYICNLVTKPNQTAGMTVGEFAAEIERFAGGPVLDYVLYNDRRPTRALIQKYGAAGEQPVEYDDTKTANHYQVIGSDLLSRRRLIQSASDRVKRTLIRHDSKRLAEAILKLAPAEKR